MDHHPLLAHKITGDGSPIVLVHGFPLDARMWEPQIAALSRRHQVLTLDLAGFGQTQTATPPTHLEDHAFDIAHLLDHLHLDRVTLVGLSMGGYVALCFAERYAHRLSSLVLANTKATPDTPEAKQKRDEHVALVEQKGVSALAKALLPNLLSKAAPEKLREHVVSIMSAQPVEATTRALEAMRDRRDTTHVLHDLTVPLLLIGSEGDTLMPPEITKAMKQAQPDAELVIIAGAGHLSNLEAPDAFNRAIGAFVDASAH